MPYDAQGRLNVGDPIAIIDIGSNSVRLVAYEGLTRAPTPIFNEKVLCGLGRNVLTTGRLSTEAMDKALAALARFRVLCTAMRISQVRLLATAAARNAENGAEFLARCQEVAGAPVELISGKREAKFGSRDRVRHLEARRGCGRFGRRFAGTDRRPRPSPYVGRFDAIRRLALQDQSGGNLKKASKIVRKALKALPHDRKCQRSVVLCRRRHVAGAGPPPHEAEGLPASCDA